MVKSRLCNVKSATRQGTNPILFCNAGKTLVTKNGELESDDTIWYHPGGIDNVLSLSNVQG